MPWPIGAHASVVAVAKASAVKAAGFLLVNELSYFHQALEAPARPLVAIIGGAKITSKLGALNNLMDKVDKLIIGGAMANTFLQCQGTYIGNSLYEPAMVEAAAGLLKKARERGRQGLHPLRLRGGRQARGPGGHQGGHGH